MEKPTDQSTDKTALSAEEETVETEDSAIQQHDSAVPPDSTGEECTVVYGAAAVDDNGSGGTEFSGVIHPTTPEESVCQESNWHPDLTGYDHTEEVPALLGRIDRSDDMEAERASDQVTGSADDVPADHLMDNGTADKAVSTVKALHALHDMELLPDTDSEHVTPETGRSDTDVELKIIMQSLQESLAQIQQISVKLDAVSGGTTGLTTQVGNLTSTYEALSEKVKAIVSDGTTKSVLSKTFLTFSSLTIAMLVIFQCYTFVFLLKTQRQQNTGVSSVLGNMSSLNKKMAGYDKNITKSLLNSVQQEHAQPHPAAIEKTIHEAAGKAETSSTYAIPVPEKINKLRNGLLEKKIIRKETGDWFVFNKKSEDCIVDAEIVEVLNQAYKKIGRSVPAGFPMPVHNALCVLKPDGKGGTDVVMTKNYVP